MLLQRVFQDRLVRWLVVGLERTKKKMYTCSNTKHFWIRSTCISSHHYAQEGRRNQCRAGHVSGRGQMLSKGIGRGEKHTYTKWIIHKQHTEDPAKAAGGFFSKGFFYRHGVVLVCNLCDHSSHQITERLATISSSSTSQQNCTQRKDLQLWDIPRVRWV